MFLQVPAGGEMISIICMQFVFLLGIFCVGKSKKRKKNESVKNNKIRTGWKPPGEIPIALNSTKIKV